MRPKEMPKGTLLTHASPAGLVKLPTLAEWMTAASYEDGTRREAPTLTIWCTSGEWRANLRDRAEGLCLWLSAETFDKLLKLADELCQQATAAWRVDDPSDAKNGKRLGRGGGR